MHDWCNCICGNSGKLSYLAIKFGRLQVSSDPVSSLARSTSFYSSQMELVLAVPFQIYFPFDVKHFFREES